MFDKKPSKADNTSLIWWEEVSKKAFAKETDVKKIPDFYKIKECDVEEIKRNVGVHKKFYDFAVHVSGFKLFEGDVYDEPYVVVAHGDHTTPDGEMTPQDSVMAIYYMARSIRKMMEEVHQDNEKELKIVNNIVEELDKYSHEVCSFLKNK